MFLLRTRWGRVLQQAPFLVTFRVKWLVYGAVITLVNAGDLGERVLGLGPHAAPLDRSFVLLSVSFSFVVSFAFLFVFQLDGARPILGWASRYIVMSPSVKNFVPHQSLHNNNRMQEVWLDR